LTASRPQTSGAGQNFLHERPIKLARPQVRIGLGQKGQTFDIIFSIYTKPPNLTLPITSVIDGPIVSEVSVMEAVLEQRTEARSTIAWPVSVWLADANRFFNGCSANVSRTGAYIKVPMTTPVRAGQIVEINFPRSQALAMEKGQFARIKTGTVVRVERNGMLENAEIGVAVSFN